MSDIKDFNKFLECLFNACENVKSYYFKLDIAGSKESIYRERVYCYELYHQFRCLLKENNEYILHGEVDKAGHPKIAAALKAKKPDFIIHVPGKMESNLAVIEVKSIEVKNRFNKLEKDLETLKDFIEEANYKYAIMLIYGEKESNLLEKINENFTKKYFEKNILLVWHDKTGERPKKINELGKPCISLG